MKRECEKRQREKEGGEREGERESLLVASPLSLPLLSLVASLSRCLSSLVASLSRCLSSLVVSLSLAHARSTSGLHVRLWLVVEGERDNVRVRKRETMSEREEA